MTATEVLRRLLDERGVEWWEATPCKTKWNSPIIGGPVAARECNGEMVLDTGYIAVTPEQAIAATLGATDAKPTQAESSGTCRTARRVIASDPATDCATGSCTCGGCGGAIDPWDAWCRHCGARMEDA